MAKNNSRGKSNTPDVTPVTEDNDTTIALPGEEEETTEMTDTVDTTDTVDVALPGESDDDNVTTPTAETVEAEVADLDAQAESLLTGDNARIANDADSESVVMLDVHEHLPANARTLKMQFLILDDYANDYEALIEKLRIGSSNKDEKVAHYIATVTEEKDAVAFEAVSSIASLDEQIKALQDQRDAADTALKAHVEAALIASGNGDLLTEEQIAAMREEIKTKYNEYKDQYKATDVALTNYRENRNPEAAEIHRYITHIPSPTGARVKPGTAKTGGGSGERAVFVAKAEYFDAAKSEWVKTFRTIKATKAGEPDRESSNPITLATEIAKAFDTKLKGTDLKDAIVDQWYGFCGVTSDNVDRAKVSGKVAEFPFNFQLGNGEYTSVPVRITPRDFSHS